MPVSARLAMWANAGLRGYVALDDALDAITAGDPHLVSVSPLRATRADSTRAGFPQAGAAAGGPGHADPLDRFSAGAWPIPPSPPAAPDSAVPVKLAAVLIDWRARRANVRLVLPVPGDVRGVPVARPFLTAALAAGEAVYAAGLGLVPTRTEVGPSSAAATTIWQAFEVDEPAPDPLQTSEAEHDLARAMRETASVLTAAAVGGTRGVRAEDLDQVRRASDAIRFPAGFAGRAAALVAQAERLDAMLGLAERDSVGGAIDGSGIDLRRQALARLRSTARRARLAGYNSGYCEDPY